MLGANLDILSWTRSDDTADYEQDEEEDEQVLFIEEEFSEYESFHILDESDDDWTPVNLGRQPTSLLKSLLSSSKETLGGWSDGVKENVRSKLESLSNIWDKRIQQSQVLQRFAQETVTSLSQTSASFWNVDISATSSECSTPTSSNRTTPTTSTWTCGGGFRNNNNNKFRDEQEGNPSSSYSYSSFARPTTSATRSHIIQVELAPLRSAAGHEEINASLGDGDNDGGPGSSDDEDRASEEGSNGDCDDHGDADTDSGCTSCQHEESIFLIPPPFPLRRV